MRHHIVLFAIAAAISACGQWKAGCDEEFIPDVIGLSTGAPRAFGVPSETLRSDRADEDIRMNRPSEEEIEASDGGRTVKFEFAH